ncbi:MULTISPECIES: efflux RND transporter periplasmic adaptor subunit [unclassified Oceanobacter]|uniref:efflux RND transporter periplasmic adaptor subunit n=1 Tax=unclassified Oceanobacter TaxID=2620260 RepID=UPI0027351BCB|nr:MULTISPECIES: efflux RND transporter periplasmic adaptor subunit [unclassified Oceanobacter]MDP2610094.1 efflux RND transporter periplasmic adaptor subunit [Oceanobacter sp. 1_MG-2023]MDP2612331.1 efflux RND transporter periplasmic adaptor subunit [Oceanobacter sp. 2_MG-2023]
MTQFTTTSRPRRWLSLLLWVVVLGCLLGAAAYWWLLVENDESQDWLVEPLRYGDIEQSVAATGTLEPKNYVEVGAQVSGQIKHLMVEEGEVVKKGQLLAEIDASVFELNVQTAEAGLENLKAQLTQQEAELELEMLRLKRNEGLYARKAISEDALFESRTNVKILKAKITAQKAEIKANAAALEADKVSLGYTRIYAPIDGTIASIDVREGQTLNATNSAPTVLQISDLSVMTLRAEVSEADVPKLRRGMDVKFATLGNPNRYRWSTVRQILPTPEEVNDVVLYQVLVDVANDNGHLMDSMTTKVFFVEGAASHVLVAPVAAIRNGRNGAFARVAGANGVERVPVELGVQSRTHAEIRSGLDEGALLITGSQQKQTTTEARSMTGNDRPGPPGGGMGGGMGGRRGG